MLKLATVAYGTACDSAEGFRRGPLGRLVDAGGFDVGRPLATSLLTDFFGE